MTHDIYHHAARLLTQSRSTVAITGAGISVDSGIPTFRGSDGIWQEFDPELFATFRAFQAHPGRSWQFFHKLYFTIRQATPNPAHTCLTTLQKMGFLQTVITQNIDGLHQQANLKSVIELHGSMTALVCMDCQTKLTTSDFILSADDLPPRCECGGILKPDFVLFGESLPTSAYFAATRAIQDCSLLVLIGTSGFVAPANTLPEIARKNGVAILELNLQRTFLSDRLNTFFIQGAAAKTLPILIQRMAQL